MKRVALILLALSLLANAWLLITPAKNNPASSASALADSPGKAAASTALPPTIPPEVWALVQSGDPTSAERLRALGLPEKIVHALIRIEVNARYDEREKALYAGDATPYWERGFSPYRFRAHDSAAALDLAREKEAELKRLLGPDAPDDENPFGIDSLLAFLPREKREQLRLIDEDYRAMQDRNSLYSLIRLPEDEEKQRYLEKQKRLDIEALLTPDELTQYDLRNSNTAHQLRWQLSGFDLTEDEYKTLFALRKPFDDAHDSTGPLRSPEQMRARSDAQKALDAQIKEALGEQRYADYKRAQDQDYKLLRQLNTRLEVPLEKINEAYELKQSFEKKLNSFKPARDSTVKPNDQRNEYRATLAREAEAELAKLLGEKATAAVSEQLLRRLRPPQQP